MNKYNNKYEENTANKVLIAMLVVEISYLLMDGDDEYLVYWLSV